MRLAARLAYLAFTAHMLLAQSLFPVAGTVVDAVTDQPLRFVRVFVLKSDSTSRELATFSTGEDGRFRFQLPAGKYSLRADRRGWRTQTFGSTGASNFGTALIVAPEQNTQDLKFRLFPPSSISGVVRDGAGEPVAEALVQLVRSSIVLGRRTVRTAGWAYTDDLGQYRFGELSPATYYISVTAQPWYSKYVFAGMRSLPGKSTLNGKSDPSFAPAYFPGTSDPREAAPLVLSAGQDAVADFNLVETSGFTIAVILEGGACTLGRLQLSREGVSGTESLQRVVDVYAGFEAFRAVAPGHYVLRYSPVRCDQNLAGMANVDLTSSDQEVTIALRPRPTISGSVEIEPGASPGILRRLMVSARDDIANRTYSRNIGADGAFTIPSVFPGKYRISVSGVPGFYAKHTSVIQGAMSAGLLDIGADSAQVKITAGSGLATVKGFVQRDGTSVPAKMIVLVAADLNPDPAYFRAFKSDLDGSFDFRDVRPGEYCLFAVDDPEFEYADPAIVKPFLKAALHIRADPNSVQEVKLALANAN
ncbi:MAG: carboxypeptidase regulatory-like domain-containing protein [Acidobacteriaceae bacterium]|nr:carboxypeptidase regulatory-like domain-containing protein [Acidobacteriaceae bacterium]